MRPVALVAVIFSLLVATIRAGRVLEMITAGSAGERTTVVLLLAFMTGAILLAFQSVQPDGPLSEFTRDSEVKWGLSIIASMILLAVYAPIITPHDPQYALYGRLRDWSGVHWFGTDDSGRDVLARILFGARTSLIIALSATAVSVIVGVGVGIGAAISRERWDNVLMRLVDAGIAFPRIFLLLALFALVPRVGLPMLVVILGLTSWFDIARLVRAEVMSMRGIEFVVAATGLGFHASRKMLRHILPNVAGPIIVSTTLTIGYLILIESGLSYIGVGLQAGTPSWGTLINEGYPFLRDDPHLTLVPGALIAATVIGFSLIGDGIRRSLDPRQS